jgi:hypothetical protein
MALKTTRALQAVLVMWTNMLHAYALARRPAGTAVVMQLYVL